MVGKSRLIQINPDTKNPIWNTVQLDDGKLAEILHKQPSTAVLPSEIDDGVTLLLLEEECISKNLTTSRNKAVVIHANLGPNNERSKVLISYVVICLKWLMSNETIRGQLFLMNRRV